MIKPEALVGKQIDEFRLDEFIAMGGMGLVYKARDTVLDRTVALKLISKTEEMTPAMAEARRRLIKEARAAAGLFHDNIVTVFSYGETDSFQYIAMEYVKGKTLDHVLTERGFLPPEEAVPIFDQILLALEAAHEQDIVHRDIKPSNIMFTEGGRVKVMDFGIAKTGSHSETVTGMILGTPEYMAPEQIKGGKADTRSDIFAVGILLYQVLTGAKPFEADAITALMYKILEADPTPPCLLNKDLPEALENVTRKALAKNPADRYQTPAEMRQALLFSARRDSSTDATVVRPAGMIGTQPKPPVVAGKRVSDAGKPVPFRVEKTKTSLQWYLLSGIALLAVCGLVFLISEPFPKTLLALRFQQNGQELLAPSGSSVAVSPGDTLRLVQVETDGWISWGTKIESPGMDAEAISKKPVAVRDLFPKESFDKQKSVELRVLVRDTFLGKVTLVVKPDTGEVKPRPSLAGGSGKKVEELEAALRNDRNNASIKLQLADLYFDGGRYPDAARLYAELSESGKSRSISERLLESYKIMDRVDEALAVYINLLKLTEDKRIFNEFTSYLAKAKPGEEAQRLLDRYQAEIPKAFQWSVLVQTSPSGAMVSVNGVSRGNSPITVSGFMPGQVKIGAALEGYNTQEKSLDALAGRELRADLILTAVSQAAGGQGETPGLQPGTASTGVTSPLATDKKRRKPGELTFDDDPPQTPATTSTGKQMFAVHVGSYRKKEEAEALQRDLAKKGHNSTISSMPSPRGGMTYTLRTTPVDSVAKASKVADQLKSEGKAKPTVIKINPTPETKPSPPKPETKPVSPRRR